MRHMDDPGQLPEAAREKPRGEAGWKAHLQANPFDIKPAFIASHTTSRLLPETILGRPSQSPSLPQTVAL